MSEGSSRLPISEIEKGPEPEAKHGPETGKVLPIKELVAQRWEAINKDIDTFREREADEALDPTGFMAEATEAWEKKHAGSEHVDTMSPLDRAEFLLALLVEQGAEWSAQKRTAVRRATVGKPKDKEQKLITQWLQDTVGR